MTQPEISSAIVWFEGLYPEHPDYQFAIDAGCWLGGVKVSPAAIEKVTQGGNRVTTKGRKIGVDVERRCYVVEVDSTTRVLLNIGGVASALQIARIAIGESDDAS